MLRMIAMTARLEGRIGETTEKKRWVEEFLASLTFDTLAEHRVVPETGRIVPVSVRGQGIALVRVFIDVVSGLEDGNHYYFVLEDVTDLQAAYQVAERKRLELKSRNDDVLRSNRRLGQFAHLAAHDLLGPVGRIASYSELVEHKLKSGNTEFVSQAMDAIRVSAVESVAVVRELLALAQLESAEPNLELIELHSVVDAVTRHQGFSERVVVNVEQDCDLVGDPRLVSLILRNVISNSYKYREPSRPLVVKVCVKPDGDENVVLTIVDNGRGFEASTKNLFEPFERMTEHAGAEGVGLGLSMVRDAAMALGWSASISSMPDTGTEVTFSGIRKPVH